MKSVQQAGVTLLEALLVLGIATAFVLWGLRQYQLYQRDVEFREVKFNVDNIFSGLTKFYYQNCNGSTAIDGNGDMKFKAGKLNPSEYNSHDPYQIKIDKDLQDAGLMAETIIPTSIVYSGPKAGNPAGNEMVDFTNNPSSIGTSGYVAQFNRLDEPRMMCVEGNEATGVTSKRGCKSDPVQVGINLIWKPQVAVRIIDEENASLYLSILGGDCLSKAKGKIVLPCDQSKKGEGNYIVWERLPSHVANPGATHFWQSAPTLKSFNQMYTTYPSSYLNSTQGKNPNGDNQYFLCGG